VPTLPGPCRCRAPAATSSRCARSSRTTSNHPPLLRAAPAAECSDYPCEYSEYPCEYSEYPLCAHAPQLGRVRA
jgi:hypothetical protein